MAETSQGTGRWNMVRISEYLLRRTQKYFNLEIFGVGCHSFDVCLDQLK